MNSSWCRYLTKRPHLRLSRAFTAIELSVVLAAVAVVLSLGIVAIARIRESARADFCRENLRRIGQGLQSYHQTYGMLPPAAIRSSPADTLELSWRTSWNEPYTMAYDHANWVTMLLPFMEHDRLAQSFNPAKTITDSENEEFRTTTVEWMLCPTDAYNQIDNPFRLALADGGEVHFRRGNYAMNGGVGAYELSPGRPSRPVLDGITLAYVDDNGATVKQEWGSGIGGFNKAFSVQDFQNGFANLIAVDEIRAGLLPSDSRGVWALGEIGGSITFWHGLMGDASGPNSPSPRSDDIIGCNQLHEALGESTLVRKGMPCCSYITSSEQATARSLHASGVNSLLLDSSTRFISNDVDPNVWHTMHSSESRTMEPIVDSAGLEKIAPSLASPGADRPATITNSIGMVLVKVDAGEFIMGLPDLGEDHNTPVTGTPREVPPHQVQISHSFYMGAYEVTQSQYEAIVNSNPSWHTENSGGRLDVIGRSPADFPVEQVTWQEAQVYCQALSEHPEEVAAGRQYRLPTEAEWEYGCRAGSTDPFDARVALNVDPTGFNVQLHPNQTRPVAEVGSYEPNAFGLYDMRGNVWEWCSDWFARDYYLHSPKTDPQGPATGVLKVIRSADWRFTGMVCKYDTSHAEPWRANPFVGFRVVCEVRSVEGAK